MFDKIREDMPQETKALISLVVRATAALATVALVAFLVIFCATHGKIKIIPTGARIKSSSFADTSFTSFKRSIKKTVVLKSGTYNVLVEFSNGAAYSAEVAVGGWMKTTKITPVEDIRSYEEITPMNYDNFIYMDGFAISYSAGKPYGIYEDKPDSKFITGIPYAPIGYAKYIDDDRVALLAQTSESVITTLKVILYDSKLKTSNTNVYKDIYAESTQKVYIIPSTNTFYLATDLDWVAVDATNMGKHIQLSDMPFSFGYSNPLIAIGAKKIVAISDGEDYAVEDAKEDNAYTLSIYTDDLRLTKQFKLGDGYNISSIVLSPDETKLAIVDGGMVRIYDLDSESQVFSSPIAEETVPLWKDSNTIYFSKSEANIFESNIDEREAYGILDGGLSYIKPLYIKGDYLYFSAHESVGSRFPTAYRVNIAD